MAYGPVAPISAVPETAGNCFDYIYNGVSTTGPQFENMLGVVASIAADTTWGLIFPLPETNPGGTCTLRLWLRANATSGNAKVNPKWAISVSGDNPAAETLSAEGVSTITPTVAHGYKITNITLDATTVSYGSTRLVMKLVFETASWTLAVDSGWQAELVWL